MPRTRIRMNILVAVIVIVIAIAYGFAGGYFQGQRGGSTTVANGIQTVLGQGTGYDPFAFSAPSGASNARLQGTFSVQGGASNEVYVLVMNASTFASWSSGTYYTPSTWAQSSFLFNSGLETAGSFDVGVPAGVPLYLVIYNPQFNNNVVRANANLSYSG